MEDEKKLQKIIRIISNKEMSVVRKTLDLLSIVDREGIDKLTHYLEHESDFFTAPASTGYHGAFKGGLAIHSYNVFKNFFRKSMELKLPIKYDSIILIGLLHDLVKINLYIPQGNKYTYDKSRHGESHGKKSVEIIEGFIKLEEQEKRCVSYHMGIFGLKEIFDWGEYDLKEYFRNVTLDFYRTVVLFAGSDMDESTKEKVQSFSKKQEQS